MQNRLGVDCRQNSRRSLDETSIVARLLHMPDAFRAPELAGSAEFLFLINFLCGKQVFQDVLVSSD